MLRKSKRLLSVKQRDVSDCGPCCLASICAYFGNTVSPTRIRQYADTGLNGTTVAGILHAASKVGLDATAVKMTYHSLASLSAPAILHCTITEKSGTALPYGHYVVFVGISATGVIVMDPGDGKTKRISIAQFQKMWTGIVITLRPNAVFRKVEKISIWRKMLALFRGYKTGLILALGCSAVVSALGLTLSIYVKMVVDEIVPSRSLSLGNLLLAIVLVLLLIQFLATELKNRIIVKVGAHMNFRLISGYYDHLLQLPASYLKNLQIGEMLSRVNDGLKIIGGINEFVVNMIVHALILLFSLGLTILYDWRMAVMVMCGVPFLIVLFMVSVAISKRYQRLILDAGAKFESQSVEMLTNILSIRHLGAEEKFGIEASKRLHDFLSGAFTYSKKQLLIQNITDFTMKAFIGIFLWTGSQLVIQQQLSIGELLSLYTLLSFSCAPVLSLMNGTKSLSDIRIAAVRLFEILEVEKCSYGWKKSFFDSRVNVEFKQVSFKYASGTSLFNGLSLFIEPGKITGIKGKSGCGKSTLLSLILKDYDVNEGAIEINGININEFDKASLRAVMSIAPQQPEIFMGTIRENIVMGSTGTIADIEELCNRLDITGFAYKLPHGIDSTLAERGVNLSGGQRQRISLARAMYRNSPLLLLDEPTAFVDELSESKIVQTIEWYKSKGNTVVMVTHNDSTLKICDNIVVLDDGVFK